MAESVIPAWFRSWTGANLSATAFASVGFTFGAILWMIAPRLGYDPWASCFIGSFIPPGLLTWYYTSDFAFERTLIRLKRWHDEGWISDEEYIEDRARARSWRNDRLYGKGATGQEKRPVGRRKKPESPSTPIPETDP